jgi:hypothetical protein
MSLTTIDFGDLGKVDTPNPFNCQRCCYILPTDVVPGINDEIPIINGTHMINGTAVIPVIPSNIGYYVANETGIYYDMILPCPTYHQQTRVYFYKSSSTNLHLSIVLLTVLLLINLVLNNGIV